MLTVSELHIYPVKSLGGIAVTKSMVTSRGLQYDRRLVLIDENNNCLTQRSVPAMALLQPVFTEGGFIIQHKKDAVLPLFVPHQPSEQKNVLLTVWDDVCEGLLYDAAVNDWFSTVLGLQCRLAYMPDASIREVDNRYAQHHEITSFSDGYPMLIIGQASLDDLNGRLQMPLPMNRFRPNIVFTGGDAFSEDRLQHFTINHIEFSGVKPCARCVMTTINQDTAAVSKEPLKTLAGYRRKGNAILFGQNLVHRGSGVISVGDVLEVGSWQPAAIAL